MHGEKVVSNIPKVEMKSDRWRPDIYLTIDKNIQGLYRQIPLKMFKENI